MTSPPRKRNGERSKHCSLIHCGVCSIHRAMLMTHNRVCGRWLFKCWPMLTGRSQLKLAPALRAARRPVLRKVLSRRLPQRFQGGKSHKITVACPSACPSPIAHGEPCNCSRSRQCGAASPVQEPGVVGVAWPYHVLMAHYLTSPRRQLLTSARLLLRHCLPRELPVSPCSRWLQAQLVPLLSPPCLSLSPRRYCFLLSLSCP